MPLLRSVSASTLLSKYLKKKKKTQGDHLYIWAQLYPAYGVVPKGLLTLLGFFMQCGVKSLLGTSGIYLGTYLLGLFAGLFSDTMGYCLSIVACEMARTMWLVLKDHIGST